MIGLRQLLSFECSDAAREQVYAVFVNRVDEAIRFWAAVARKREPLVPELMEVMASLPGESASRLVTAPETYHRLVYTLPGAFTDTVRFFQNALAAEKALIGEDGELERPVWTALGDAYFPAGPLDGAQRSAEWRPDRQFRGARILGRLVVDGVSPFSTFETLDHATPVETYQQNEIEAIAGLIDDAMQRIGVAHPAAFAMITLITKVIVVKKQMTNAHEPHSSSSTPFIGRVAIANAHSTKVNREYLANAVVHETIHSLLFMIEMFDAAMVKQEQSSEIHLTSPWTARSLPLDAFIHACFVWYGLAGFWRAAVQSKAFSGRTARKMLQTAESGFKQPLSAMLRPVRTCIRKEVLDAIDDIQHTVAST